MTTKEVRNRKIDEIKKNLDTLKGNLDDLSSTLDDFYLEDKPLEPDDELVISFSKLKSLRDNLEKLNQAIFSPSFIHNKHRAYNLLMATIKSFDENLIR